MSVAAFESYMAVSSDAAMYDGEQVLALDIHLPFSYWRTRDFDYGDPAMPPRDAIVARYIRMLKAEIASLGDDLAVSQGDDEVVQTGGKRRVGSVYFSGGYLGLLHPDDFRDILCAVRRHFAVNGGLVVEAVTSPGSIDMYAASAYLDEEVGTLMFEVPTLSARESRACGVPNVLQALDKTLYVLGSYGAAEFGVRIPVDIPGRTSETWEYLVGQLGHYRPVHIEFVTCGTTEERSACFEDEGLATVRTKLEGRGYRSIAPDFLTRADYVPAFVRERIARLNDSGHEYLGVGLGAQTCLDGFWTKNTTDLPRYLSQGADYRNHVEVVREV